jgi:hypothetical protein
VLLSIRKGSTHFALVRSAPRILFNTPLPVTFKSRSLEIKLGQQVVIWDSSTKQKSTKQSVLASSFQTTAVFVGHFVRLLPVAKLRHDRRQGRSGQVCMCILLPSPLLHLLLPLLVNVESCPTLL